MNICFAFRRTPVKRRTRRIVGVLAVCIGLAAWGLYFEVWFWGAFGLIVGGCGAACFVPELFPEWYRRHAEVAKG